MSEPTLSFSELVADPDGGLARLRARGAVVPMDLGTVVVEYEAVRQALSERGLRPSFSDFLHQFGITSGPFHDWMSRSPLDMDGDEHRRWRSLMARTFTPKSVERLRPFLARESARLVDTFPAAGRVEFVEAFARKLPSLGLCELIGVPSDDRVLFSTWADTIGLGFNLLLVATRIGDIDAALLALLDFSSRLVEARRKEPRDDLVTRIAQAAHDEGGIDETLIIASVAGLVFAGHETTKNQLGWMLSVLAEVPAEWDRVAKEPARAHDVVEEVLRLRSTVTSVGRTATSDVEVAGASIAKGTRVVASVWGANRDPGTFTEPERFDADLHKQAQQIAFGHGAHHCLGAALARAELQEALIALAARITCPRLEAGASWLPPVGITGPLTLPIAYEKRTT